MSLTFKERGKLVVGLERKKKNLIRRHLHTYTKTKTDKRVRLV